MADAKIHAITHKLKEMPTQECDEIAPVHSVLAGEKSIHHSRWQWVILFGGRRLDIGDPRPVTPAHLLIIPSVQQNMIQQRQWRLLETSGPKIGR
jgi:hypothetical protein